MKLSQVVGVVDAHNRQLVPAYLGDYPRGALLLQLKEGGNPETEESVFHTEYFAYWNSREWSVIDTGGTCSMQGRLVHWIVISQRRN